MSPVHSGQAEVIRIPCTPGPRAGSEAPVWVSFTDFRADSVRDARRIAELGVELSQTWPVLQGAVGLWLWSESSGLRGGSVSVWEQRADMDRFVRWQVHRRIMSQWRARVAVESQTWSAEYCDPEAIWARALGCIRAAS